MLFSTSEAAKRAGLTRKQLNYWNREGFLVPAERTRGGHARYTEAQVKQAQVIRILLDNDFSLQQIRPRLEKTLAGLREIGLEGI